MIDRSTNWVGVGTMTIKTTATKRKGAPTYQVLPAWKLQYTRGHLADVCEAFPHVFSVQSGGIVPTPTMPDSGQYDHRVAACPHG